MNRPIFINGWGSISALGTTQNAIAKAYSTKQSHIELLQTNLPYLAALAHGFESPEDGYGRSVHLAFAAAKQALEMAGWSKKWPIGIQIGSSRGATDLLENALERFFNQTPMPIETSPNTSLGNVSSNVGQWLQVGGGPVFSHSMTCSTASFALLNALAWLQSDMAEYMLVGGTEAAITPFTIRQMENLRIYSKRFNEDYPCLAGDLSKTQNTMVLGEGAAILALSKQFNAQTVAQIKAWGMATEPIRHSVDISSHALNLQKAMQMALNQLGEPIDAIVTHTPGTLKGDMAEFKAIEAVFGDNSPVITNNKWKIGHTFGASSALSIDMALHMIQNQTVYFPPFTPHSPTPKTIRHVMVNSMGFGGNAVSVVISKVNGE